MQADPPRKSQQTRLVTNEEHYACVLRQAVRAQRSLWIGTADIKDLHVARGQASVPFLGVLAELLKRGVEVRLIHAKEPGENFRKDFDRYPILARSLERVLCPRVHFKIMVIDFEWCYVGSANLTGAGMGMKSPLRRNFEAGVFSSEPELVRAAIEEFDRVWRGEACPRCGRRRFCPDPVVAAQS